MAKPYLAILATTCLLGACTDTLVYGERTGLNIAIRTDAAEGHPLEVNTGLQRRIVGYVPPRNEAGGEAVNMISAFNLTREDGEDKNPLNNKVTIETAFASGAAATVVGNDTKSVKAIFNRPGVTASPNIADQQLSPKIITWVGQDEKRARRYLDFLNNSGGVTGTKPNFLNNVNDAANNGDNAKLNIKFAQQENIK
ncbi:MAG: hypothetical protein ABJL67_15870 [Sulfitobacter sp.]